MDRMWMLWVVVALTGCFDVAGPPEPVLVIDTGVPAPDTDALSVHEKADAPPRFVVDVSAPLAKGCAEPSLIGVADFDNTTVGQPVLTEVFGADGCLDERWVHEWDTELMLHEHYDFFDPEIARYVYVQPMEYSHRWTYDGQGRVLTQTRAREVDGDPWYWENTRYDELGRIVERVINNDPMSVEFGLGTLYEMWTYPGESTEFETHRVYRDHSNESLERRVFDEAGRIVEQYYTQAGAAEQIRVRSTFDADGKLVVLDTWDGYTGAAATHATFEYRADATLARKVEKDLQHGWLNVWEYDGAERQILYTQDETDDGSIEYRQVWRHDAHGNVVFTSTEYDFGRPQPAYSQTVSRYDAHDRLTEQVSTEPWMRGESYRTTNQYDRVGAGFVTIHDHLDSSGRLTSVTDVARWRNADQLSWRRSDTDADGEFEMLEIQRWYGAQPLEQIWDYDGDGFIDAVKQWHYDAVGQLVEQVTDDGADGVADARTLYER